MMTKTSRPWVSGNDVRLEDCCYRNPYESADRKLLYGAIVAAVLLHAVLLLVPLPGRRAPVPVPARPQSPRIWRTQLPPPAIERRDLRPLSHERRLPVPERSPEDLGPVPEPLPQPGLVDVTRPVMDPDELFVSPVPPPERRPLIPDGVRVTMPVLIEETKIAPIYPPIARVARREGHLILSAIIDPDGSVREVRIVRVDPADFGFEDAAIEAVRQWRYEPATQRGLPVAVSFTIYVSFDLR